MTQEHYMKVINNFSEETLLKLLKILQDYSNDDNLNLNIGDVNYVFNIDIDNMSIKELLQFAQNRKITVDLSDNYFWNSGITIQSFCNIHELFKNSSYAIVETLNYIIEDAISIYIINSNDKNYNFNKKRPFNIITDPELKDLFIIDKYY